MKVAFFEPWYGGSHRAFLDAWERRTRHDVTVYGLAPRHWKWRQEASAWELARKVADEPAPDVIVCSDFVDLPRLMGFLPPAWRDLPTVMYFHENQLTYRPDSGQEDFTHGFCNVLSAVRADQVLFNSDFHRRDFAAAADRLLQRLPRPNPREALAQKLKGSGVIAPLPELADVPLGSGPPAGSPLRVVFPHRLEPDKDPVALLGAIERVAASDPARSQRARPLELVLLGGQLERAPQPIQAAAARVAHLTIHSGYAESRDEYLRHLASADLVVSTARHEFFGVAFAEAMAAGCTPLAPNRLNYPALTAQVPDPKGCLYDAEEELVSKLGQYLHAPQLDQLRTPEQRAAARGAVLPLDADCGAQQLDNALEPLVRDTRSTPGRNGSRERGIRGDE